MKNIQRILATVQVDSRQHELLVMIARQMMKMTHLTSMVTGQLSLHNKSVNLLRWNGCEDLFIRDYLNRLNGYARNPNIKFENGGRKAREQVKDFLETKSAHFLPTTSNATTRETAKPFRDFYQRLHGLPLSISEVTNIVLSEYLRHFVNPYQSDWDELQTLAEFPYNSRNHASIRMSPFMTGLGYEPRSVADCVIPRPTPKQRQATLFLEFQQTILGQARETIGAAQANWQRNYDKNRHHTRYGDGDDVLLNTSYVDLDHVGTDGTRKFTVRFIGLYRILSITVPDRYKLDLPPGLQLFPEFHVSMLRPYHHDTSASRIDRVESVLTADGTVGHLDAEITNHHKRQDHTQYFVRWQDSTIKPSWEPLQNLSLVIGLIYRYLDILPKTRAIARLSEELWR
ncbi:hypothetical protein PHMEG_00015995 [Phytophthora megakarya]|uniref:Tf2-1-like SH3-like domain-containing protein n=1 Tax=Phytophthora megakarya TaxID=4795 RepID=A0A225W033_9STRA|nr:hypothetical protein PHMEG_00015995 [Phytophthora megakarya]